MTRVLSPPIKMQNSLGQFFTQTWDVVESLSMSQKNSCCVHHLKVFVVDIPCLSGTLMGPRVGENETRVVPFQVSRKMTWSWHQDKDIGVQWLVRYENSVNQGNHIGFITHSWHTVMWTLIDPTTPLCLIKWTFQIEPLACKLKLQQIHMNWMLCLLRVLLILWRCCGVTPIGRGTTTEGKPMARPLSF